MAKPERFSQDKLWKEKISSSELESWVRYVQEEFFSVLKSAGEDLSSKDDIKLIVIIDYVNAKHLRSRKNANAIITVMTKLTGGSEACYRIASFVNVNEAISTFREYTEFKNAKTVITKDNMIWTEKITVA